MTERDTADVWKVALDGAKKKVGTVPEAVWSEETQDKGGLLGVAVSPTWNGTTDQDVFLWRPRVRTTVWSRCASTATS
ncbi:hypothetical protein LT493_12410 [Streptomyces tricolor]|nr:hypothetical protein [Streptomyces tricolor]